MEYAFEIRDVPQITVLSIRASITQPEMPAFIGAAFGELYEHASRHGVATAGEPFIIYHTFGPGALDVQICAPITGGPPTAGRIELSTLPAATVAHTLHVGPYERLADAYDSLMHWVADHGYEPSAPVRERYLTGPDTPPDQHRTEIDLPVTRTAVPAGA